jgi:hypothetical protein
VSPKLEKKGTIIMGADEIEVLNAITFGERERLEYLWLEGFNVVNGENLFYAVLQYRKNIVEFLLSKGADINFSNENPEDTYYNWTPLDLAIHEGFTEIVEFLKSKGAKQNINPLGSNSEKP